MGLKEGFMISLIVSPEEILIPTNGTATNWTSLRQWLDKGQATVNSLENQSSGADGPDQAESRAAFLESWPAKPNNSKGKFLLHTQENRVSLQNTAFTACSLPSNNNLRQ